MTHAQVSAHVTRVRAKDMVCKHAWGANTDRVSLQVGLYVSTHQHEVRCSVCMQCVDTVLARKQRVNRAEHQSV